MNELPITPSTVRVSKRGQDGCRKCAAKMGRVSMWSSTCGHAMVEYDIPPRWDLKLHGGESYSTVGNEIPR